MKPKLFLLFICILSLTACNEPDIIIGEPEYYFQFTQSEMIIEVDENTTSFKIEIEYFGDYVLNDYPPILFSPLKSTAKEGVHYNNITHKRLFKQEGENKMYYLEKLLTPNNINEEVTFVYEKTSIYGEPKESIKELTVILRPKNE